PHINLWLLEKIWHKKISSIHINQTNVFGLLNEKVDGRLKTYAVSMILEPKVNVFVLYSTWFSHGVIICNRLEDIKDAHFEPILRNIFRKFYYLSSNYALVRIRNNWKNYPSTSILFLPKLFLKLIETIAPPKPLPFLQSYKH